MEGLTRIEPAGSRACGAGFDPYLPIGIYAALSKQNCFQSGPKETFNNRSRPILNC